MKASLGPTLESPSSQACTAAQMGTHLYKDICLRLNEAPRYHRKQWEYVYIYRGLESLGKLQTDSRGLGFGVGTEPLVGAFANLGIEITATDLPISDTKAELWKTSGSQHSGSEIMNLLRPGTCPEEVFLSNVRYREVDMNHIPPDLLDYDFCWSSCALEHLGSISNGLRFIEKSLDCLKPRGVAIHTTELRVDEDANTLDHAGTVIFRSADMISLSKLLAEEGHSVLPLNFNFGDDDLDRHIDMPPYSTDNHLKLMLENIPSTSFGIIIIKAQESVLNGKGNIANFSATEAFPASNKASQVNRFDIDKIVRSLIDTKGWEADDSPNTSATGELARDIQIMKYNIKTLAWKVEMISGPPILIARSVEDALKDSSESFEIKGRLCTSSDIYSKWHRQLASALRAENFKLRKIWEWTYTIKALHSAGFLEGNKRGLGFGCGTEPLASCFANFVGTLMITDAPPSLSQSKDWAATNQYTEGLESIKYDWLAPRSRLDEVIKFGYADMNDIPASLFNQYDFIWSSCALEHLGTKSHGLQFIINSARCLRPGGLAIHTTEFDLSGQSQIDNWPTVLFNKEDLCITLAKLVNDFNQQDCGVKLKLLEIDLERGNEFIDGYIDIPPYGHNQSMNSAFLEASDRNTETESVGITDYAYPQINLSVDGFPSTSVAILIKRLS